jgi:hypothetical protein
MPAGWADHLRVLLLFRRWSLCTRQARRQTLPPLVVISPRLAVHI